VDAHATAPNRYLEANGIRYAYRRFGSDKGVSLLFLQHFRADMDHWDALVTDGLGERRSVILVDGAGAGGSGGATPDTIEAMAEDLRHFLTSSTRARATPRIGRDPAERRESSGGRGQDAEVALVAGNPTPTLEDFLFLFILLGDRK
jgi:hypothetical protein